MNLFSGCPELSDANGDFEYTSSVRLVGSNATLTCDSNFEVSGSSPVTCMESGWTGTPNCARTSMLLNLSNHQCVVEFLPIIYNYINYVGIIIINKKKLNSDGFQS